ncbi:F0F1 ATP synthase subunit B [Paenibacillus dokdonensis]|uniref:F0F1 ATP synthase subunit B n=1 Tax=Paenibacillus dokdonensis TaxID=2567944 RepID=UPI001457A21C|nr:F0F1 ATP synthase subunit B [Paenibacillus dokdonensis]
MNLFSVTTIPSAIIAGFAFLMLYLILSKYVFGPLFAVMEQRQSRNQVNLESANQLKQEMQRLEDERNAILKTAALDANELIRNAVKESAMEAEQVIKAAREESNHYMAEALAELQAEKQRAIEAIQDETQEISNEIVKKLIPNRVH